MQRHRPRPRPPHRRSLRDRLFGLPVCSSSRDSGRVGRKDREQSGPKQAPRDGQAGSPGARARLCQPAQGRLHGWQSDPERDGTSSWAAFIVFAASRADLNVSLHSYTGVRHSARGRAATRHDDQLALLQRARSSGRGLDRKGGPPKLDSFPKLRACADLSLCATALRDWRTSSQA